MIKLTSLNKYFNRRKSNEIHVLNDISLSFPEKGFIILHGPSGSGKTTLLNVISGLDKINAGAIDFNNKNIKGYNSKVWDQLRSEHIGYVFQNYNLLPELSVSENVAFALRLLGVTNKTVIKSRVDYVLKAVNMYPFRKKKSHQLSGGQQQRVALARALVKNPKVIIADEPTGNLDSKNTLEIMNILRQISMEKLVVMVTHEKEIAKFYGERIIELSDGKITNDYINQTSETHNVKTDDTIYLKDLNTLAPLSTSKISLSSFSDKEIKNEGIAVKLIIKNNTLYIDVDSKYKQIKLIDKDSGITIKDENYVQKTRKELVETSFDLKDLDNTSLDVKTGVLFSLKKSVIFALKKVLLSSAKAKLLLFSFFSGGVIIAMTASIVTNTLLLRPESVMNISHGNVLVTEAGDPANSLSFDDIVNLKEAGDDSFYINPHSEITLPFSNPLNHISFGLMNIFGAPSTGTISGQIDLVSRIETNDLLKGRLPSSDYEILISKSVAEATIKSATAQEVGVWEIKHLLYEKFIIDGHEITISGIVDTDIDIIYLSRVMASHYSLSTLDKKGVSILYRPYDLYADIDLVIGSLPNENQIVISLAQFEQLSGSSDYSGAWPREIIGLESEVSGIHDVDGFEMISLVTIEQIERKLFETTTQVFVYTKNYESLVYELYAQHDIEASESRESSLIQLRKNQQITLASTLITSGIMAGFILLGFYFTIRSSLTSRVYEISVHRALGVRKGDILKSFIIEILILTTLTSLIGYLAMSLALSSLLDGIIGNLNFFYVSPVSIFLGVVFIYMINMIAGLLPVIMLLRKTPAEILSQYDI